MNTFIPHRPRVFYFEIKKSIKLTPVQLLTQQYNASVARLTLQYNTALRQLAQQRRRMTTAAYQSRLAQLTQQYQAALDALRSAYQRQLALLQAPAVPATPAPKKSALFIGINYLNTQYELNGCINDARDLDALMRNTFGYTDVTLLDDTTASKPTRANILAAIRSFVSKAATGDTLFFSYSGHGSSVPDTNGDEPDGLDEVIITKDLDYITDDELRSALTTGIAQGVNLFCIFDSCESGSILDLRYIYTDRANQTVPLVGTAYPETRNQIVCLSGCQDGTTSTDAYINGRYNGALTWAFLQTQRNGVRVWRTMIDTVRQSMVQNGFDQVPQLSSGQALDVSGTMWL